MSVAINTENIIRRFGKDTIINGLPLDVRPDELSTLLGPSGCGKTALLRMIIGFNSIEGGETKIDSEVINNIPIDKRNMGMIFQNYVIFPHMSVRDNVAFGLKNRKMPQAQIEFQVDEMLKVVKIDHLKKRVPSKLLGSQQQCVALVRAIVIHPRVLFMDEPLSNLDVRLRVETHNVIKQIQQQMGITTLYVTHDQEEALAVSDRITVMNGSVIQQIDTPENIYQRPTNLPVSTFIELSNILDGIVEISGSITLVRMGDCVVAMDNLNSSCVNGQPVKVSVRPEELILDREVDQGIPAIVRSNVPLEVTTHYFAEVADGKEMEVIQNSDIWGIIPDHTPVRLGVQPARINVYNQDGSESPTVRREHS